MNLPSNSDKPFSCPSQPVETASAGSQQDKQELPDWEFDDEFDGGDETCGRVIVNLYLYIRDQQPGLKILVISRDPGAPVELPAWCRMTKNQLTKMKHPYYLITLKPELLRSE
jgi:TusA-related sulfurtransferase